MAGYFSEATAQRGINSPYDDLIVAIAGSNLVDPMLVKAVISAESGWNPTAYRAEPQINDASYGLMQILLATARGLQPSVTAEQLADPSVNIALGTRYLAQQLNRFGYPAALAAYNGGPGNVSRWLAGTHPQQANVDRYVATVDSFYSWFTHNDPLSIGVPEVIAPPGPFRGDSHRFVGRFSMERTPRAEPWDPRRSEFAKRYGGVDTHDQR